MPGCVGAAGRTDEQMGGRIYRLRSCRILPVSLSQAEDATIVNGVHELGHKWCAYPRHQCTSPISLCTYPLNSATSDAPRGHPPSSWGTCRRADACLPAYYRRYQIAQRLPGRTDHAIRNRYHRLQAMMHDQHLHAQQNHNQMMMQLPDVHGGAAGLSHAPPMASISSAAFSVGSFD